LKKKNKRFLELIEPLMQNLENFALAMCRNRDIAKDLVAGTVMLAFEQFGKLRNEQAFLSFLFTICKREYYSKYHQKINFIPLEDFTLDNLYRTELNAEDKLDIEFILGELDKMDIDTKESVILHYVSGLAYSEIAKIQNRSTDAVKMSVFRAKKSIRENLNIEK
jgi:RNA polymerase sigma-70 factor (ECF subfamily)